MDLVLKRKREIEDQIQQQKNFMGRSSDILEKGDNNEQFFNKLYSKRGISKESCNSNSGNECAETRSSSTEVSSNNPAPAIKLKFSNDGSFLEQFKKLTESKVLPPTPSSCIKKEIVSPSEQEMLEDVRQFAAKVAKEGDHLEDDMRSAAGTNSVFSFLLSPVSSTYLQFRRLVSDLRSSQKEQRELVVVKKEPNVSGIKIEAPVFVKAEPSREIKQEIQDQSSKKRSRWGPQVDEKVALPPPAVVNITSLAIGGTSSTKPTLIPANQPLLSQIKYSDPEVIQYAKRVFGTTNLTDAQWKQCTDQLKMQYLYQELQKKKMERDRLERAGKVKYEYDSDEDTEGGTWEHKRRRQEMEKTKKIAEELTQKAGGAHHIGDYLPPEELAKFTSKYQALKTGKSMTVSDYEDFKIAEDNVGFKMLQKFGWTEGKGLGASGSGITAPINMNATSDSHGLGMEKPGELSTNDDEFDVYRKRMMLAYRFRPNPLNNPRRPYY
ncbi:SURP and G-patch domain-containing protein 1-like isoform X2 [Artemia franciscana]|uniref:G-patch domain-containing protein n=1 Tax=Artemia franciscana TaxID=6661 RepID=A0AA88KTY6_ARTSF|nr:hypothetical protein QYM36_014730 [Artemia franciscana]